MYTLELGDIKKKDDDYIFRIVYDKTFIRSQYKTMKTANLFKFYDYGTYVHPCSLEYR